MQFYNIRVTHSGNQIIVSHKQGKHIFHRKSTNQVNEGQFILYDFSGFSNRRLVDRCLNPKQANSSLIVTQ